jgi:hypothetical protein
MLYGTVRYDPARHQLFVLHIRKTGGTSLYSALAPAFPPPEGSRVRLRREFTIWAGRSGLLGLHERVRRSAMRAEQAVRGAGAALRGVRTIDQTDLPLSGGHYTFPTIPRGARELLIVTLLREPLARFLSDWRFMREKRDRSRGDCLDARLYDLPLVPFVERILAEPALFRWNTQCLQLAGVPEADRALAVIGREIWLAGPTERVADMARLIGDATGRTIPPVPHLRRTGGERPEPLPEALASALRARMAADASLYAAVAAAFDRLAAPQVSATQT